MKKPNSPNPVKKKKKKTLTKKIKTQREREKKKRRRRTSHLVWKEKEKKEDEETKLVEPSIHGTQYVVLIKKMPLKIELWKLKTLKMCFQFSELITQKLENWVMETKTGNKIQTDFSVIVPTIFELWVIETTNPNSSRHINLEKMSNRTNWVRD